jgi:3-methyl-2-oxobutanoate hydroxymethyltransferase
MASSGETPSPHKVRVDTLIGMKAAGRRIAALTAYDFLTAQILDRAGIDLILVGDSLGNVILGHSTTVPVTMSDTGAGPFCDGQILVLHDMLGLTAKAPRFVKRYASLADEMARAVDAYRGEVSEGAFPAAEHCYKIPPEELQKLIEEEMAARSPRRANH